MQPNFSSSDNFLKTRAALHSSLEKTNKIIPHLVIGASHLSGSNGVGFDLDGANHIVDFKTLQGLSHYDNTSTIPGVTLEKGKKLSTKSTMIVQGSLTRSCMARSKIREAQ